MKIFKKPNLLLLMIDCMRADFFYKERGPDHTPNLKMLLDKGLSFTSFYSVTTTTTPSTATVLTGMYPITSWESERTQDIVYAQASKPLLTDYKHQVIILSRE